MSQPLTILEIQCLPLGFNLSSNVNVRVALANAVDETFCELGHDVQSAFYAILRERFGLSKEDAVNRPEAFAGALEAVFGQAAKLVEVQILSRFHEKFKGEPYKCEKKDLFFSDHVSRWLNNC
ncbi:MAG: hypothetical protein NWE98_07715 [Candidatus Bathyarchaeota archaeon]|nr:hypothetical protein [Candidatus Bathyarchaeota archaeon]